MINKIRPHSLPLYAWAAALTISILCCLSALGGGMLAWVSEADAQAINTAGSIRMAAYQINFQLATNFAVNLPFDLNTDATNHQNKAISESNSINQPTSQKVTILIEDMENRLAKLDAYQLTNANDSQAIDSQLTQIHRQWLDSLKPALMSQDKQKFYIDSIDYIKKVDRFVSELQHRNEKRQIWQQVLQIGSLIIIITILLIGMYKLRENVLLPVQDLIKANSKFKQGDRQARAAVTGYAEFSALARSFNDMASIIATYQHSLESEVDIKTQHLVKANQVLSLFYNFSKYLSSSQVSLYKIDELITDFGKILPHLEFTLCIHNNFITSKNSIILHGDKMKELCKKLNCDNCISNDPTYSKSYPIAHLKEQFGDLRVRPKSVLAMNTTTSPENEIESIQLSEIPPPASTNDAGFTAIAVNPTSNNDPNLDNENNELIVALTSLICTALSLRKQKQQEHQLILFEERATIARELHDSLAQSLSYLKIQISVLERNLKNGCNDHIEIIVRQHIAQIKQGLNSAYQQLRDLLITFRLTIDNDNFEQALHEAAKEFADKGRFDIELNNRIMTLNLSATEQINLIQIAREALSNITRHAQAKNVEINLAFDDEDKHIVMSISDDGVGMPDTVDQTQHHGLMIMKERAHNLNGELSLAHYEPHGTIVTIKFVPNFFEEDKD